MTGLLGGGHAIYYDAASGKARNLDCFVAVPGLGAEPGRRAELLELEVPFGTELVHYAVGIASCGVPGLPAGLGALHAEHGRLPWARLVEPALRLARDGVEFPRGARGLPGDARAGDDDERGRRDLLAGRCAAAGGRASAPARARPGARAARRRRRAERVRGSLGAALLELMDERGGLVTRDDLAAYEAIWSEPVEVAYAGTRVLTRAGLAPLADCLEALPTLRGRPARRARGRARARPRPARPGGRHDQPRHGRRGRERLRAHLQPRARRGRMAAGPRPAPEQHARRGRPDPRAASARRADGQHDVADAGARRRRAGAGRRRRGRHATAQRARRRCWRARSTKGFRQKMPSSGPGCTRRRASSTSSPAGPTRCRARSKRPATVVRVWPDRHHYFGGVSVVTRTGAAGDPRRSGAASDPSSALTGDQPR